MSETFAENTAAENIGHPTLEHRKIKLADGRYMIFYTFSEKLREPAEKEKDQRSAGQKNV